MNSALRIAFATYSLLPDLHPDDRLAAEALVDRGHRVTPAVWNDETVGWGEFDMVVLRSTWDYFHQRGEFLEWARRVGEDSQLWNPSGLVEWNTHKSYLLDLESRGVGIVPTELAERPESLESIALRRGWTDVVVKPVVSAASEGAFYVPANQRDAAEGRFAEALQRGPHLVQPFQPAVLDPGERSLVFIDGQFTHAFRKGPALPVDRRDEDGYRPIEARSDEIEAARKAVDSVTPTPLYTRVDLVPGPPGPPLLMELEIVEPYLHFEGSVNARRELALGIERRAAGGR